MDQFISKIQPFADLIDNVSPYANAYNPEWASSLNDIAKEQANCLTFILQAFENNNPASLSDEIGVTFLPLIKKIKNLFLNDVIPQLEEMVNLATNPAS